MMRPVFLHLDDALLHQRELVDRGRRRDGLALDARATGGLLRLWCTNADLRKSKVWLKAELPLGREPDLVFLGSGDFHHVSTLLIGRAVEQAGEPISVVHFDNHPDWMRFAFGVHCGSWVGHAAHLPGVARILTVGVCSPDISRRRLKRANPEPVEQGRVELYAWRIPDGADAVRLCGREWPSIGAIGTGAFAEYLVSRIPTQAVYVTIDKDVLAPADALTNWDQGEIRFGWLQSVLESLIERRRLVGADVVGDYSRAAFGGPLAARVLKRGEAVWDQPRAQPDPAEAARINQPINLALLDLLAGRGG